MKTALMFNFSVDKENKRILVQREFTAPLASVWNAWTTSELLDQWWAPRPYKTETIKMDFRKDGRWFYAMAGPTGDKHYCVADYLAVNPQKSYQCIDAFADEKGNLNKDFPRSTWNVSFSESGKNTMVNIEIQYKELADLEKFIELGFKEGFTMAMGNLDEIFQG